MLAWILLATIIDSLVALIGVITLFLKKRVFEKLLMALVAFSAGGLLAGAFFHLLSESLEHFSSFYSFAVMIFGFVLFFFIERILHWHHCHEPKCEVHPVSYLILLGDGVHNFIDGLIIAVSFLISVPFGIITTLLIIGHEIPQELGDFAVLVYSGFSKKKALKFNFLSQTTCIIGGIIGFLLKNASWFFSLIPFAAGGFLYIASSDLIPELHKEKNLRRSMLNMLAFLAGISFIIMIKALE